MQRFLSKPKDFTFEELRKRLKSLGYEEARTGKTSGSRVVFYKEAFKVIHHPYIQILKFSRK